MEAGEKLKPNFRLSKITRREFLKMTLGVAAGVLTNEKIAQAGSLINKPNQKEAPQLPLEQEYSPPSIIDGLETFGADEPLNEEQLKLLTEKLNSLGNEKRDDTYYGTVFVTEETYKRFIFDDFQESFQSYLRRHEALFNQMLIENPIALAEGGFKLRRLIVINNNVPESDFFRDYYNNRITDCDDQYLIKNYQPSKADYYDPSIRIDLGLLHEWGHYFLHLNDFYSLDFFSPVNIPPPLREIPLWQKYYGSYRDGIDNDGGVSRKDLADNTLMAGGGGRILGLYNSLQLANRGKAGRVHNLRETLKDIWLWPADLPEQVVLRFYNVYGLPLIVRNITVYETEADLANPNTRVWHSGPVYNFPGEIIRPVDIFPVENGAIKKGSEIIFLDIDTDRGKYFRWMDIRDFNIAKWMGKEFLQMCAARYDDYPGNFNSRIDYR